MSSPLFTNIDDKSPKESPARKPMQFVLNGFKEDAGFRVFAFEGVAADKVRTNFTVRIDLALSRRYGIRLQDLPLLCRSVLDGRDESEPTHAYTYSEEAMHGVAALAAERLAAAKAKRPPSRSPNRHPDEQWSVVQETPPVSHS
jgi:hypothetical protein